MHTHTPSGHAKSIPVTVNVDDAAVLKEAEVAAPGKKEGKGRISATWGENLCAGTG